jgi:hypothetical protein
VLSAEATEQLKRSGFAKTDVNDHRIQLNAEGTCRFRSYWIFISGGQSSEENYIDRPETCAWEPGSTVVRVWPDRGVIGEVTIALGIRGTGTMTGATDVTLLVKRQNGKIVLGAPIGDPDQGRTIDFVRTE